MPKLTSYLKALLSPDISESSEKSIRMLPHWNNLLPISPRDQHEIHTQIIPKVGANTWQGRESVDLDLLQKYYDCHDLVYSSIDLVSSTFALAELKVKQRDVRTGKYKYVPNHPLQLLLDNPNNSMSGYDLRQAFIVHRLLFGTMGVILIRESMLSSNTEVNRCPKCMQLERAEDCIHVLWHFNTGPVTQILPVHLDRLDQEEVDTPRGKRTFFIYDYGNGIKTLVHPNNIMTDPMYNPGGSFYGSSPTARVERWLEIDLGLSKQIGAYLSNNAIPSMIMKLNPPKFTDGGGRMEDPSLLLQMMKEKWMKDFSMNAYNQGHNNKVKTPAFVYGDFEVMKIQDGIKDIVQKPLFYEIQDGIARAYKIPPTFFEYGLNYSDATEQHNKDFYNRAIAPQLKSFQAKIKRYILPSYNDPTLEIEWDLSSMGIAAFLEDKKEAQILKRWELGGITLDEMREAIGMNPYHNTDEGNDRYRISVMSDSSGNNQVNQNKPKIPKKPDNRLLNDPEVDRQANGITHTEDHTEKI